ncbi:MAG: hypothetical protein AB7P08_19175 [Burkholderiales bacterium]
MSERRETPWERWSRDSRALLHLTEDQLTDAFVTHFERVATNDRLVPIDGVLHELPLALGSAGRGGAKVQITQRLLDETYHVVCLGRLVRIHAVDPLANARSPRARRREAGSEPATAPVKTAADMAYERELGSVLDDDGGALPTVDDDRDDDRSATQPQEAP